MKNSKRSFKDYWNRVEPRLKSQLPDPSYIGYFNVVAERAFAAGKRTPVDRKCVWTPNHHNANLKPGDIIHFPMFSTSCGRGDNQALGDYCHFCGGRMVYR